MPRTFYTIDDLATFCKDKNFTRFSSKEHDGRPLVVQSVETFEVSGNRNEGLMPVQLQACHIGVNRNRSCISEEVMKSNMNTFKGRPILGSIIKTDTGEFEFHSHDMNFTKDGDVEYIEQPVGVISEIDDPYLSYDEEKDKTYLNVKGNIFTEYSKAAEILERRKTCRCSVEIAVNEMSWNCDEDYLSIDDFYFLGVTILGYEQDGVTPIEEGMKGSNITIESFSEKNNSMFNNDYSDMIVDLLSKIDKKLDSLSYNKSNQKGVEKDMNHFEELLEKYSVAAEDINFDYENMSDEELDAKFEELFGESVEEPVEEPTDEPVDVVVEEVTEEPVVEEPVVEEPVEQFVVKYEISHDDIRMALYELLSAGSEDGFYNTWIVEVFDNKFIYENYEDLKFYRQGYSKNDDNVVLDGEPVEVFNEWLSKEEKDALDSLKSSYAELKEFKEQYDAAVLKAEKDAIVNSAEYAEIAESDEFKALVSEMDKYSVEEIKVKADLLFAASMKKKFNFEVDKVKKSHSVGIDLNAKTSKKKPYGKLFND